MLGLAKQILLMSAAVISTPAPSLISVLAHRMQTPATFAPTVSNGTTYTYSATYINDSGAPITVASILLCGYIRNAANSGETPCGNDFPVTGNIEYPVGTPCGTFAKGRNTTITVVNNENLYSDEITLSATIPTGGSFKINLTTTVANGLKYITQCGFAGLRTKAMSNTLAKVRMSVSGDSIPTLNSGAFIRAAAGLCPVYNQTISGTTAQSYASNFTKRLELAALQGITHFVSDFGTNDFGTNNRTVAQLQADLTTIRDGVRAAGMKFVQTTITPRTTMATITASGATYSGGFVTLNVPDASKFEVGRYYEVIGASPSGYNGFIEVAARDTTANTITYQRPTLSSPATGTITITSLRRPDDSNSYTWSNLGLQVPVAGYEAGGASKKALINDWIRGGNVDGVIDWGDALETSRNSGIWATGVEKSIAGVKVTGLSVTALNSGNSFKSDYAGASGSALAGYLFWKTGANAGYGHLISSQTPNGVTGITLYDTPPNAIAITDTFDLITSEYYNTKDGLHPYSVTVTSTTSRGGQKAIEVPITTYLSSF